MKQSVIKSGINSIRIETINNSTFTVLLNILFILHKFTLLIIIVKIIKQYYLIFINNYKKSHIFKF